MKTITIRLVLVCALISLAAAQAQNQQDVRYLFLNDANLIETARGYALSSPILLQHNWKTVSVNGDNVIVMSANCQSSVLSKQALMQSVQEQNLITSAKQSLYAVESGGNQLNQMQRSGSAMFSLNALNMASMRNGRNVNMASFSSNGLSISKFGEQSFTIARAGGLPDNVARIFVTGDVVTYVYNDLRVLMKPIGCLTPAEQQQLQAARQEVQRAQQQFNQGMQQFHQNMHNMRQNMQMNMQNMQQRLQQGLSQIQNRLGVNNAYGNDQMGYQYGGQQQQRYPTSMQLNAYQQMPGTGGYGNNLMGTMMNGPSGLLGGGAYSQSGANGMSSSMANGNWPFGQNNSPFYQGFPFRK